MQEKEMLHHACPRCGQAMNYTGGKFKLQCGNCGYNRTLGRHTDQVDNHPLKAGISLKGFSRGMGEGLTSYGCGNCGTILARSQGDLPSYCPICRGDKDNFEEHKHHKKVVLPAGVIPFTISEQEARAQLRAFFREKPVSHRFLPNTLLKLCDPQQIQGVYVPIFIFDALTRSTWLADSGFQTDSRMIWEPTTGYYEHFFEDFDVPIVGAIPEFGSIYDYDLRAVVSYDSRFLRGFSTELYQFDELDTFQMADEMMSGEIRMEAQGRAKGDQIRKIDVKSEKFALAFRHILVPLWIGVYDYEGETYTYLINGQTGSMHGANPLDARKIVLATGGFALLVVILGLVFG